MGTKEVNLITTYTGLFKRIHTVWQMTTSKHIGVVFLLVWCCSQDLTSKKGINAEQCSLRNTAIGEIAGIITEYSRDQNRLSDKVNALSEEVRQQKKQLENINTKLNDRPCERTHVLNVRHYHVHVSEDQRTFGTVQSVRFYKDRGDTAIRVTWLCTTNIRDIRQSNPRSCGRYYVTFNGRRCANPGNIDFTDMGMDSDHHQATELDGMCYGQPAGLLNVSIVAGACPNYSTSDFYTGWRTSRDMWVYELDMATHECSESSNKTSSPTINTQYYVITDMQSNLGPNNSIMTMIYNKLANDTALRIKWTGSARVAGYSTSLDLSMRRCARWFITVDGAECLPRAYFTIGMLEFSKNYAADNHKTRTLEGVCLGITAGIHNVVLRIGTCQRYSNYPLAETFTGCCQSTSRMIVSEIRMGTPQTETNKGRQDLEYPFFNLKSWFWENIDSTFHNAVVKSVSYTKLSGASGLHVRAVGDGRVLGQRSCCRWYFTIRGNECRDPGTIEGIIYFQNHVNYHSPIVVDGVCYGIGSGNINIEFKVSQCTGFDGESWVGHSSTVQLIIEETQPGQRVSCSQPLDC